MVDVVSFLSCEPAKKIDVRSPYLYHDLFLRECIKNKLMAGGRPFNLSEVETMEKIYDCCCGVDVHKKILVVCLMKKSKKEIREFQTYTRDLINLAEWLVENECQMVAMESTGSYWKPLFNVLESFELKAMVVNAQHMKAVPGRKTDVKDAEWIADLLSHGLLKASFIPPKPQRELRELCAYRKSLVKMRSSELNRLQKMLEGANVKLSGTVSHIKGKSAQTLLSLSLADKVLDADLIRKLQEDKIISKNLKATPEQLARDLEGCYIRAQKIEIDIVQKHIQELDAHIEKLSDEIDDSLNSGEKEAVRKLKKIPGISDQSAQQIIAVIGTDMTRSPTDKHLC